MRSQPFPVDTRRLAELGEAAAPPVLVIPHHEEGRVAVTPVRLTLAEKRIGDPGRERVVAEPLPVPVNDDGVREPVLMALTAPVSPG